MPALKKISYIFAYWLLSVLFCLLIIHSAHAEVIDRIQINQAGDEAEIQIHFVTRVQFLRQVPLKNGDIRLYFNLLEIDPSDKRLTWQRRESPPSILVPRFTATYPEIDSSMTLSFGKDLGDYHIRPGNDGHSISIFTPISPGLKNTQNKALLDVGSSPTSSSPVFMAITSKRTAKEIELTELEAKQLMENAENAQRNNLIMAQAAMLRKLVSLPANKLSQSALLSLGEADEKLGEFAKARADYYLYITQYSKARNVETVRASLMKMVMASYVAEKSVPEKVAIDEKMIVFGGFSQYFNKSLVHTNNIVPAIVSTNASDQSQLLSTLELTGMQRSESTETRFVLRNSFTENFIQGVGNNNFLDAAYLEQAFNNQSYYYGIGRQTGASGGLPSRFDGTWLGHNFNDAWRINATLGQPARVSGSTDLAKTFAAVNLSLTRLPGEWSGNAYFISQQMGKLMDKRAAGIEAHYYDGKSNHTGLIEYDTLFKTLNFSSFQGNWITPDEDNYTLLIDHRRSPSLESSNALLRVLPTQSISTLGYSPSTLQTNAMLATPIINQMSIGMTHPYTSHLKLGGDIRISNTTSYQAYDVVKNPTLPFTTQPSLSSKTYSAQIAGSNLLFDNDLGLAIASFTRANTFKSESLTFSQVETFKQDWRLDLACFFYSEHNEITGDTNRISPSLKLSYQFNPTKHFEFGAGYEQAHFISSSLDSKTRRKFFNLGYRWDFQ